MYVSLSPSSCVVGDSLPHNLGNVLSDMGPEAKADALAAYRRSLDAEPEEVCSVLIALVPSQLRSASSARGSACMLVGCIYKGIHTNTHTHRHKQSKETQTDARAYSHPIVSQADTHGNYSLLLQRTGRLSDAHTHTHTFTRAHTHTHPPTHTLALRYLRTRIRTSTRTHDTHPHIHTHSQADTHANFSLLLQRAGRLSDALKHAREATRLAPKSGRVWLNLAGMLLLCGEMEEALAAAKKCVRTI